MTEARVDGSDGKSVTPGGEAFGTWTNIAPDSLVAVNRHVWTDEKGAERELLAGEPLDPKMPGYAELVAATTMTRADFDAIEDDDRAKRIGGLRKRIAELQAAIDELEAEDAEVKARRAG